MLNVLLLFFGTAVREGIVYYLFQWLPSASFTPAWVDLDDGIFVRPFGGDLQPPSSIGYIDIGTCAVCDQKLIDCGEIKVHRLKQRLFWQTLLVSVPGLDQAEGKWQLVIDQRVINTSGQKIANWQNEYCHKKQKSGKDESQRPQLAATHRTPQADSERDTVRSQNRSG